MNADTRKTLIDRYKDGYRAVSDALVGASDEELDARPAPHKWTAREVVHHLADSEMTAAVRLRLLVAVDNPQIVGYDQERWAASLDYHAHPVPEALAVVDAVRASTTALLRRLPDEAWRRAGRHTESGPYTAEDWLRIYAAHLHDHADQIDANVAQWRAAHR